MSTIPANVKVVIAGNEVDPTDTEAVPGRIVRRLLTSEARKAGKKFSHLKHPETGEVPNIVLNISDTNPAKMKVDIRLVTDSLRLREWLNKQGVAVAEEVTAEGAQILAQEQEKAKSGTAT